MLSDEEKEAIDKINNSYDYNTGWVEADASDWRIVTDLIEKQQKEIEELKDDRKKYAEEYIHNNPWLYKQLNENYILRVESEQKERKAWIKGTNDADELCNKKWKDKIKAKIEEIKQYKDLARDSIEEKIVIADSDSLNYGRKEAHEKDIEVLQSLLDNTNSE